MDYLQSMQSAIDFMEEHLLENITYEDVARHVYMSNYHFHRLFSMLTGFSANEYMRNRRLSMAGQELLLSDKKVIDVALKYGYESPETMVCVHRFPKRVRGLIMASEPTATASERCGIGFLRSSFRAQDTICWMIRILNCIMKMGNRVYFVKYGYRWRKKENKYVARKPLETGGFLCEV